MAANADARLTRLGGRPGPATPERPRDLPDDRIEIDVSGDAGPPSSGTRIHADLDPVLAGVDHEIDLVVAEVSRRSGGNMADEHVSPIGGSDSHVAIGVVDFEHDRLVEVNGNTILAPRFRVTSVRHDSSSERWWVPFRGQERRSTSRHLFRDD